MKRNGMQPTIPTEAPRKPPVRVKMKRFGVNYGKLYPPGGDGKKWWAALKAALGTASSSFVYTSLEQLQAAARLPNGLVSEAAMNAAFAFIQAIAPKNEIEAALAIQMACTHSAAMAILGKIESGGHPVVPCATAAATLMRTYTLQLEALRRLRGSEAQHVRVGHVHINDEGRAVIGAVALGRTHERDEIAAQ
jgi:hypothetical protein